MNQTDREDNIMNLSRRDVAFGVACTALAVTAPELAAAQGAEGPFKLDPLPYARNALEPHIDARTMELHHDRHHQAYVDNLNAAVKEYPAVAALPLVQILVSLDQMPESIRAALRNAAGGHANHTMFWRIMGSGRGQPEGQLLAAIERDFGGVAALQARFNETGLRVFGSGWVFVTVGRDGRLAIETRPNQDTPLSDGKAVLVGNDMWEHAYYLSYLNRRADYLKAWWNVVNWGAVRERHAAALAGMVVI
jgi:Fe-Mn family superoxide dismutase